MACWKSGLPAATHFFGKLTRAKAASATTDHTQDHSQQPIQLFGTRLICLESGAQTPKVTLLSMRRVEVRTASPHWVETKRSGEQIGFFLSVCPFVENENVECCLMIPAWLW